MLVLLATLAFAEAPEHHFDGKISTSLERGEIVETQALWLSYLQIFEPDELPEQYREQQYGWLCGTGVVKELKENWGQLTPAQQQRVSQKLTPWQSSLMDDLTEPPVRPPADSICWSPQGASTYKSEHFQIEWDTGFDTTGATSFANALEYSYDKELGDGWREPLGMDDYLMQVYVEQGQGAGAYTTVRLCGGILMPYIVVQSGSFRVGTWFQTLAAHEFNHASQYAYGQSHQFWFWEATATWAEEYVYEVRNDWSSQITEGYNVNPQLAMHASGQQDYDVFNHMYGMGIWLFYIDEKMGGPDLVREIWEYSRGSGVPAYELWQDDAFAGLDLDFEEAYEGFLLNNTVMDFEESEDFGRIRIQDSEDDFPADGEVFDEDAPQSRGASYLRFDTEDYEQGEYVDLMLEFDGDGGADWTVLVAGVEGGDLVAEWRMEIEDDAGLQRIENAADYDEVWMIPTPMVQQDPPSERFEFDWEANPVPPLAGSGLGACGCQSAGGAGWLAVLPGLLLLRRRQNPV